VIILHQGDSGRHDMAREGDVNLQDMFDVRGKSVIVTGGGSGIGLAIVEILAEHGARVAILDISLDRAEGEAARLRALGQTVRAYRVDVGDGASVDAAIDSSARDFGGIDVLFANAGIDPSSTVLGPDGERSVDGALENYDADRWSRVIDISLNGVFHCVRASVRHMKPRRSGRIIITTSVSSVRAMPIGIAYSAAKAGAAHFMRNAALELARYNIRVNAIAPGPFVTNIGDGFARDPAVQTMMSGMIPLGRMGDVEEMKGLALFLASPASSFMTGAEVFNDGGLSLGPPID
jgi:NAD(P)-dependent dehydrogenase (short-subunit alcohol dehydrogenase family)